MNKILRAENPITKFYNEDESGNNVSAFADEDDMDDWLANIEKQNALLPSYVMFNNIRHLSLRLRFTDMIQKMNYSSTIPENWEEEPGVTSAKPKNSLSLTNSTFLNSPGKGDFRLEVNKVAAIPVRIGKNIQSSNREKLRRLNKSFKTTSRVYRTPVSPPNIICGSSGLDFGALSKDGNLRGK